MRCPGQDPRYWTGEAAFEVPCPKCGRATEFFKDESSRRCPACGFRFQNPQLDLSCATWCAWARQCLGFSVPRESTANLGEGALAGRLIQALKEQSPPDPGRLTRALVRFQHAKELAQKEGGDPRVVFTAVLLLETAETAESILKETGLDAETIARIGDILAKHRLGRAGDSIESCIVHDCAVLAQLAAEAPDRDAEEVENVISRELQTETGKIRARHLFTP